jgi:pentatricopeptide repeat protein
MNAVLNAWAKSRLHDYAPERAEALFDRMVKARVRPDVISYNTLIHAWSVAGDAERAECLLDEICQAYRDDVVKMVDIMCTLNPLMQNKQQ